MNTVPVRYFIIFYLNDSIHPSFLYFRLVRPQNNLRKKHPDRQFTAESYNSSFEIVEILGPNSAVAITMDDKASV